MTGYSKLFGSIIHSSIWQAPDNVRLVWITMLAMKDQDGIVEASIRGLAKAAGQSIEQTKHAIEVLSAPDEDSRTPDHEGRRIAAVDGGWAVLNHHKYRDKLDLHEQRAKEADRKARLRSRTTGNPILSRDVPQCPAMSRNVPSCPDASAMSQKVPPSDTDTYSGMGALVPDQRDSPSFSGDQGPDLGGSRVEHIQAASVPAPPVDRSHIRARGGIVPPDPELVARRTLGHQIWDRLNERRQNLAHELGLAPPRILHDQLPGRAQLAERLRESGQQAASDADHVLRVAEAEARRTRSLQFFSGSMFEPKSWARKLAMTVADAGPPETAVEVSQRIRDRLANEGEDGEDGWQ